MPRKRDSHIVIFNLHSAGNNVVQLDTGNILICHAKISCSHDSIVLFGRERNGQPYERKFNLGDVAEFESGYESRFGKIEKITSKEIHLRSTDSVHVLNLREFAYRNWNFDENVVLFDNLNHYLSDNPFDFPK